MNKQELRKTVLNIRRQQTQADVDANSKKVLQHLSNWQLFKQSLAVLLYMDYAKEVKTAQIIDHCLMSNKDVIVPVVNADGKTLTLVQIDANTKFTKSSLGIMEPIVTPEAVRTLYDVDLVLAPGVAFDLDGNRIGYGGGYYDRLLDEHSSIRHLIKVYALAFECQIVDSITADANDQKIDGIITEKGIYHDLNPNNL